MTVTHFQNCWYFLRGLKEFRPLDTGRGIDTGFPPSPPLMIFNNKMSERAVGEAPAGTVG